MIRSSLLAGARRVAAPVALSLAVATASAPVLAASQRTFVSTTGVDNPACSIAAPCRGFAAAIAATNAGGEVIVQDSGGYGPVTIAKSVSILAPAGVYAGISVFSGNGVTVATPATTDKVVLQGLVINSQGSNGNGIHFTGAGTLEVARTRVSGFQSGSGVRFDPAIGGEGRLHAVDLALAGNDEAVAVLGGLLSADTASAVLERIEAIGNTFGLYIDSFADIVVVDSTIAQNIIGVYTLTSASTLVLLTVDRCAVSRNLAGFDVGNDTGTTYVTITGSTLAHNRNWAVSAGNNSTTRLAGTTIAQNAVGIQLQAGGVVESQGNNFIWGNTTNGPAPTVVGSK